VSPRAPARVDAVDRPAGIVLNMLGLVLIGCSNTNPDLSPINALPYGVVILGLGGITYHLAQQHVSCLFPRKRGLITSIFVAGFTGCGIIFYILYQIFDGVGGTMCVLRCARGVRLRPGLGFRVSDDARHNLFSKAVSDGWEHDLCVQGCWEDDLSNQGCEGRKHLSAAGELGGATTACLRHVLWFRGGGARCKGGGTAAAFQGFTSRENGYWTFAGGRMASQRAPDPSVRMMP
jgi:hypothetical protein